MNNEEAIQFLDNIKGEEAGRSIGKEGFYAELLGYHIEALDKAIEALKGERTQGEWIYGEDECGQDGWFCSNCGFFVPWYYQFYENDIDFIRDYKVCPHCETEMITYTGKDRDMKEIDNEG